MMEPEIIQRFLESVGQKADVDLYLKLFRSQSKESFAIIAADAQMVRTALDPFHFDLRILAGIGLYPVVLLGLFDAKDADKNAQRVYDWLVEDDVPARIVDPGPQMGGTEIDAIRQIIQSSTIPIVSLEAAREGTTDGRFNLLSALATGLGTRKVIFLSPSPGLQREGAPHIPEVNLPLDYARLLSTKGLLARRHYTLLRQAKELLDEVPHRMHVTVVSPLSLLRELFTVSGAGTMIRRGAQIDSRRDLAGIDRERLLGLFTSAFGRRITPTVLDRPIERIYLEERYLGAAVLSRTPVGIYLSKFAVERTAQGEGIGGDVWSALIRDFPSFFWRSRPDNPITPWYVRRCDGLVRLGEWHIFWRGLAPQEIEPAVLFASSQPSDFEVPPPPAAA